MAGPRTKRKRTDTDAPPPSRRRARDPTSSGPERVSKNETKLPLVTGDDGPSVGTGPPVGMALNEQQQQGGTQVNKTEQNHEKLKDGSTKASRATASKSLLSSDGGNEHANPEEDQMKGPLHQTQSTEAGYIIPRRNLKNVVNKSSSGAAVRGGGVAVGNGPGEKGVSVGSGPGEKSNGGGSGGGGTVGNNNKPQNREKRIRSLILHRKLLLERLQQGRTAAQNRLNQLEEEDPSRKSETGAEERLRFAALGREITSLARKQSRAESTAGGDGSNATTTDKRISLSLRRGASVGKRMNAALSSLAPGSTMQQQQQQQPQPQQAPIAGSSSVEATKTQQNTLAPTAKPSPAPAPLVAAAGAAGADLARAPVAPITISESSLGPSAPIPVPPVVVSNTATSKKAAVAAVQPNESVSVGRGVGPKAMNNRQMQQQQQQQGMMATGRASTKQQLSAQAQQLANNNRVGPPPLPPPPNVMGIPMRRPVPPTVVVPEAVVLRERKKAIGQKLLELNQSRTDEDQQDVAAKPTGMTASYGREFAIEGVGPPSQLPKRRRTHWDTLLDEMRWLATDFIEERKWKANAAHAVANAVSCAVEQKREEQLDSLLEDDDAMMMMETDETAEALETVITNATTKPVAGSTDVESVTKPESWHVFGKDEDRLRAIARANASMVSKFWSSCLDDSRRNIMLNCETMKGNEGQPDKENSEKDTKSLEEDAKPSSLQNLSTALTEKKHAEADAISQNFETVSQLIVALRKSESKSKSIGANLLPHQAKGVGFMEDVWKKGNVGCLLSGAGSSGKTFATCSVLWKNRANGPQLVVCSPDSLVKWCDELSYFDGINVLGVSSILSSACVGTSVVGICTFSEFTNMKSEVLSQFRSFVVDSRYPVGFRGSRPKICFDTYENSSHSLLSVAAPNELASTDWWERIVSCVVESNPRRILVDPFNAADLLGLFDGFCDRAILEHLALRVAFLFGQAVFPSDWILPKKNLLSWARRHIKRTAVGDGSKFIKVRDLFCGMLDTVTYELVPDRESKPSVNIVPCAMTPLQRSSYETCCNNVQAALSRSLDVVEDSSVQFAFRSIADALLRIRRICTHAHGRDILLSSSARRYLLGNSHPGPEKRATSQPDAELASLILAGSGKFRELSRILLDDGGVQLDKEVEEVVRITTKKSSRSTGSKKVAILAVLPEVQLLVSLLLGALGVCHEAVLSCASLTDGDATSSAWVSTQHALSRFNDKSLESSRIVNVVVASPIAVAGNHGGLGVESADLVVVVDEDWSGRGELLIRSLLTRVALGKEQAVCRVLRLVSKNSCEENFIASDPVNGTDPIWSDLQLPWAVSPFGLFQPPKDLPLAQEPLVHKNWNSMGPFKGIHVFPGKGIFDWSDENLEKVLGNHNSSRPLFGTSLGPRFLPSSSGSLKIETQVCLIKHLSKSEGEVSTFSLHHNSGLHLLSVVPPFANDFCLKFSLDDPSKLPISEHIHRVGGEVDYIDVEPTEKLSLSHQPVELGEQVEPEPEMLVEKVAEKRDILAGGLLVYNEDGPPVATTSETGRNAFASSFRLSTSLGYEDGNQGMEMLVYFPPLFPRLIESSIIASESVQSLRRSIPRNKRVRPNVDPLSSKRPRIADGEFIPASLTAEVPPVVTEETASQNDAASVLFDLEDDYGLAGIGAIPMPRDSALFASQMVSGMSSNIMSADARTCEVVAHAEPSDHSEAEEMRTSNLVAQPSSKSSVIVFVSRKRQRGQMGLQSFQHPIRSQQNMSNVLVPWGPLAVPAPSPPISNGVSYATNGADLGDRFKRRSMQDAASGSEAFAQPNRATGAAVLPNSTMTSKTKDIQRSRLLAASRQFGHGATLFDAAPFRAAAVRLRNKMVFRLSRLCWQSGVAYETGPGLPLAVSKPLGRAQVFRGDFEADPALWTSVVKRLKNPSARTGDEAIEVSLGQSASLRKQLTVPSRVDFGPFNSGFLYLPSGMTAISPPRPSSGVNLPMGVKLPPTAKDQIIPWTPREETILKETTLRFGTNWTLCSRALSGLQDVVTVTRQHQAVRSVPRAAKSCREHWQTLARNDPTLTLEVKKVERTQREKSTLNFRDSLDHGMQHKVLGASSNDDRESVSSGGNNANILILLAPDGKNEEGVASLEESDQYGHSHGGTKVRADIVRKRSFSAIASARKKLVERPNSRIADGSSPNIAPSHPSHMQSVQSSIASSWTSGRTEMWPLQFLDASDRFRASKSQQQASTSTSAPPTRSPSAVTPVSRQHGATAPPVRTSSSGVPSGQHQAAPTNTTQRPTGNSYPPPVRGDSRAQATMNVFAPPPSQPPSAARQSSVSGGSPARK